MIQLLAIKYLSLSEETRVAEYCKCQLAHSEVQRRHSAHIQVHSLNLCHYLKRVSCSDVLSSHCLLLQLLFSTSVWSTWFELPCLCKARSDPVGQLGTHLCCEWLFASSSCKKCWPLPLVSVCKGESAARSALSFKVFTHIPTERKIRWFLNVVLQYVSLALANLPGKHKLPG